MYRESNLFFVNCPLYGVCTYLGGSVMKGFTVAVFGSQGQC